MSSLQPHQRFFITPSSSTARSTAGTASTASEAPTAAPTPGLHGPDPGIYQACQEVAYTMAYCVRDCGVPTLKTHDAEDGRVHMNLTRCKEAGDPDGFLADLNDPEECDALVLVTTLCGPCRQEFLPPTTAGALEQPGQRYTFTRCADPGASPEPWVTTSHLDCDPSGPLFAELNTDPRAGKACPGDPPPSTKPCKRYTTETRNAHATRFAIAPAVTAPPQPTDLTQPTAGTVSPLTGTHVNAPPIFGPGAMLLAGAAIGVVTVAALGAWALKLQRTQARRR
jgi:hypothetical protein